MLFSALASRELRCVQRMVAVSFFPFDARYHAALKQHSGENVDGTRQPISLIIVHARSSQDDQQPSFSGFFIPARGFPGADWFSLLMGSSPQSR
jgi:hypothetical protein